MVALSLAVGCGCAWKLQDICTLLDPFREFCAILLKERCLLLQPFEDKCSEGVPIDGLSMTLFVKDFCYQVLGRATHGRRATSVADAILAEVEVSVLRVPSMSERLFSGFEVALDDVQVVQVLARQDDFGGVGPATVLTETTRTVKKEE